jgi:hypothetical protein
MPRVLNNIQTADAYNDFVATLELHPPGHAATVVVTGAAAFVQLRRTPRGMRAGSGTLEPEEFWVPSAYTVDRDFDFDQIRFRSAVPGNPAQVSARG